MEKKKKKKNHTHTHTHTQTRPFEWISETWSPEPRALGASCVDGAIHARAGCVPMAPSRTVSQIRCTFGLPCVTQARAPLPQSGRRGRGHIPPLGLCVNISRARFAIGEVHSGRQARCDRARRGRWSVDSIVDQYTASSTGFWILQH